MIVVNFSHPITDLQHRQLEEMTGETIAEVRNVACQLDNLASFGDQIRARVNDAGLSPLQWQTERILINPPSYAPAASTLIAELHGRMGYFPSLIRIRPVAGATPPAFEVAEVINLQAVRDAARQQRQAKDE